MMETTVFNEQREKFEKLLKQGYTLGEAISMVGKEHTGVFQASRLKRQGDFERLLLLGYNQKDAAQMIGVTQKTASQWVKDNVFTLTKLAKLKQNVLNELGTLEFGSTPEILKRINDLLDIAERVDRIVWGTKSGRKAYQSGINPKSK